MFRNRNCILAFPGLFCEPEHENYFCRGQGAVEKVPIFAYLRHFLDKVDNIHHYNRYKQTSLSSIQTTIITFNTNKHHYHQYNQPSLSSIQINLMVMGSLDAMESGSGGVASVLPAPTLPSSLREKGGKV